MDCFVFLGGTAKKNPWRDDFLKMLKARGINPQQVFNPVVPEGTWSERHFEREDKAKRECRFLLIYIGLPDPGNPERVSPYSLVEVTSALHDQEERTVVVFDLRGMERG